VLIAEDLNDIIQRAVREAVEAAGLRAAPPAPLDPDTLLSREDGAAELTARGYRTSGRTLATKATRGRGPPYRRFGPRVVYRWGDLLAWAEGRLSPPRSSTAEADRAEQSAPRSLAAVRRAHPDALGDEGAADA
jgi:8-oxo-dGTP pyrophosphatase MutT (NUDIX family)